MMENYNTCVTMKDGEKQVQTEEYKGFALERFAVDGRESLIVYPEEGMKTGKWIWRTEFFGAFDAVDMEMVKRGYCLLYHKVSDLYGAPVAIEKMDTFYRHVTEQYGLEKKVILFGFSRGGLYAVNFASAYPDRIAALYLDAPVTDIRSWPCRFTGSRERRECMAVYDLTEESLPLFSDNPNDKAAFLAQEKLPVIIVAGDSDAVVPYQENGAVFSQRYEAAGGTIRVILKKGCDHHPHSLDDPAPVADWLEQCIESEV